LANIRAALAWALEGPVPEKGISAAQALKAYWILRGLLGEGQAWLEKALSRVVATQSSLSRAGLLLRLGEIAHHSANDEVNAYEFLTQARAMYQDLGDRLGYARATLQLARIWTVRYEESVSRKIREERYAESAAIFKELSSDGDLASALFEWGCFRVFDDFEDALSLLADAERLYRKLGSWYIGGAQWVLAWTYWRLDKPERARHLFQQALDTVRPVNDQWILMMLLAYQGEMEMELASDSVGLLQAEAILLEDLEICRKFGSKSMFVAYISDLLGKVAQKRGEYSLAMKRFQDTLPILQELGAGSWGKTDTMGRCLFGLVKAAASMEKVIFSAQLLGALNGQRTLDDALWEGISPADFERVTAAVRSQLDEATFQSAWNAGQAMTLDEAIAYALD
jgi:tetratricopeptide (TPR) repeat protein